jgi:hypothetical protein
MATVFATTKKAFARERLTVTNAAVFTLTQTTFDDNGNAEYVSAAMEGSKRRKATGARIVADSGSGDFHFSEEGTAPTSGVTGADVGAIAGARDVIVLDGYEAITKFKARATSATNAILEVVYYR